jgi:aldehyde:ferredoxin oxidoreductase
MGIREKLERLVARMHDTPQYNSQGAVLFVDLEQRKTLKKYLPIEVLKNFLGGRGANMCAAVQPDRRGASAALDPEIPLIFGSGVLTSSMPSATRGNITSKSPDSYAILDANAGDYFPSFPSVATATITSCSTAAPRPGPCSRLLTTPSSSSMPRPMSASTTSTWPPPSSATSTASSARTWRWRASPRLGENQVLCSGIMGGIKAIWARGGGGAKMGSLKLKGIMIHGAPRELQPVQPMAKYNKVIGKKIIGTSVIKNALKMVGTPFLYKPSRVLCALGTKNNQQTSWKPTLDADNFDPYRPGMDGCYLCPVHCRNQNDMTPGAESGWGAAALKGLTGNASYDKAQAEVEHGKQRTYNGIHNDGKFDQYDKGDGPEYVTVGKFGPMIGISEPEQVLRLNNILNDLGLDSASTGSSIAWAMELYQRGIITQKETGGLDLTWGNYELIEKLLFMTAKREGFGDTIADSARAVERGKYPQEALDYRMTVKGLFQSDPHDSRILKAFALGLSVATRGMDHLRNRVTLEINARINDDPAFKTALYNGTVSAKPNSLRRQGICRQEVREQLRGRRFGRHVPLQYQVVQLADPARPQRLRHAANVPDRPDLRRAGTRRDRPQRHGHRAHAELPLRPARQGRHFAKALVRGSPDGRSLRRREDRAQGIRWHEGAFLRADWPQCRRHSGNGVARKALAPDYGVRRARRITQAIAWRARTDISHRRNGGRRHCAAPGPAAQVAGSGSGFERQFVEHRGQRQHGSLRRRHRSHCQRRPRHPSSHHRRRLKQRAIPYKSHPITVKHI